MGLGKTTVGVGGATRLPDRRCVGRAGSEFVSNTGGGQIQVFVQPGNGQGNGKVLFTGAVGDYGSSHPVTSSGGRARD